MESILKWFGLLVWVVGWLLLVEVSEVGGCGSGSGGSVVSEYGSNGVSGWLS